jgi:hypothetical protein
LTLDQLATSMLVIGPGYEWWDEQWRRRLVDNLRSLVHQLLFVGVSEIFVDGSFVEDKLRPADIDGYFACGRDEIGSGRLEHRLNSIDPYRVWTWDAASRSQNPLTREWKLPMWHRYHVELWPHFGQGSGITDEFGNELEFPAAFRKSRRGHRRRGIVKIVQ